MLDVEQKKNGEVKQKIADLYVISADLTDVSNSLRIDLECVTKSPDYEKTDPKNDITEMNTLIGSQLHKLSRELECTFSVLNDIRDKLDL